MAKEVVSFDGVMAALRAHRYAPVYYLMGDEPYYIDLIADYVTDHILSEQEKEFNLTVAYGSDTNMGTIINAAKRYPMMAEHQVVVVKEAQNLKDIDDLVYYLMKPQPSTILVFCHKNGVLDRRKKVASEIVKNGGVLFESSKIKDSQLPQFIMGYIKEQGFSMDPKAVSMMADNVGADLSRLTGELDKLIITQPKGQKIITPEQVELNIGISKDYNIFELRNALIEKNVLRANRIVRYFAENPKSNPIQQTLAVLFNFFSNLMLAYYAPQKNDVGVADFLNLGPAWKARDYCAAMRKYSGLKTLQIIREIRYTDARSKGIGQPTAAKDDLLRDLVFKILH